jgi:hypothetical protein
MLLDYCAGKLNSEQAMLLEAHLDHCQACREFRDGQAAIWNALDAWQEVPVSEDFDRRLYARIDAEKHTPWYRRLAAWLHPYIARPAIPIAAVACLLIFASYMLNRPGTPPATVPMAGNGTVQVEQVERVLDDIEMLKDLDLLDDDGGGSQTL